MVCGRCEEVGDWMKRSRRRHAPYLGVTKGFVFAPMKCWPETNPRTLVEEVSDYVRRWYGVESPNIDFVCYRIPDASYSTPPNPKWREAVFEWRA